MSMKLVIMSPSFPSPKWETGTRNYHLLKTHACEHTVSLLALVDTAEIEIEECNLSHLKDFVHTVLALIYVPGFMIWRLWVSLEFCISKKLTVASVLTSRIISVR